MSQPPSFTPTASMTRCSAMEVSPRPPEALNLKLPGLPSTVQESIINSTTADTKLNASAHEASLPAPKCGKWPV
jgi:hypothetical protein